jgi:acyl-CoA synthetase (AMP-forming)/AMP-acid ligase II
MTAFAGQPAPEHSGFVVDEHTTVLDEHGRPVPPGSGAVGRLARRGHLPLGYHRDPERTRATFPVIDGVRWAVPGDLATVEADGTICLLGRGSESINTGGEKVHAEEVEAALKSHPEVDDAVVVGVPDDRWGERVAAVVALRNGREPCPDALVAHCRGRLAGFKAPRQVVTVDQIRRGPSGKVDYPWARGIAAEASP